MSNNVDRIAAAFDKARATNPAHKLLSVFLTAGYPQLEATIPLCRALQDAGADMIEVGFPFSDPLADGPTIQASSSVALDNGMSLKVLFGQLAALRESVDIPILLMGYLNPILQYGVEAFCQRCEEVGVDGLILPDLPLDEYVNTYQALFAKHGLKTVWLITPRTTDERIKAIDELTTGFIYVVSSHAVTGNQLDVDQQKEAYFQRVRGLELQSPLMVGFGIHDRQSFLQSTSHADGGIIGSAFIKALKDATPADYAAVVTSFVHSIQREQAASGA